jgi:putative endonuclease
METTKEIGTKGEELAADYLRSKGYKILTTNWFFKHKELDIVATFDNILVIVEVKTRATSFFENPQDSIDRKKQRFIIDAANSYIFKNGITMETRFDIIAILFKGEKYSIEHIEDAFYPIARKIF